MAKPTLAVYLGSPQSPTTAAQFWADPSSWTNVISSLREVSWKRGRQGLLDVMGNGSGTLVFNNNQREWEPTNPSAAQWPLTERQIKIEATLGTTTYSLFRGWTHEWDVAWDTDWESGTLPNGARGGKSEVEVELLDHAGILALWEVNGWGTASDPGTVSMGSALMRELDQVGFTWANRTIDTTSATDVVRVPDRGDAWTNMQDYIQSDIQLRQGWFDGRGFFIFGTGADSGATFGDSSAELRYGKMGMKWGRDLVVNAVGVTGAQPGAIEQTVNPSRAGTSNAPYLYGQNNKTIQTRNATDADSLSLANAVWDRNWQPRARPSAVTIRPGDDSSIWTQVLDLDLQDTFLFRRSPPGTGTWEQKVQIMSLQHTVRLTEYDWTAEYNVAGEFVLFPAAVIVDTADRANEGPPMTGWTNINAGLKVVSNQIAPNTNNVQDGYYNTSMTGPDVDVAVTIATQPVGGGTVYLMARLDPAGGGGGLGDGYVLFMFRGGGGLNDFLQIRRYDNSVNTDLGAGLSIAALADGDCIGMRCRRSTIEAWYRRSGVWKFAYSTTDATYSGASPTNKVGLGTYGNLTSTACRLDDFIARAVARAI